MISGIGYGALVTMFGAGLVTGLALRGGERRSRATRPLSGAETPEQSLARLSGYGRFPMKGGQVLMGPRQPRPTVQLRVPEPPPRGGGGVSGGGHPRPWDMPTRGTTGGAGQAYGGPGRLVVPEHIVWR